MTSHHDVVAGTEAVVRKPRLEETAGRGTRGRAADSTGLAPTVGQSQSEPQLLRSGMTIAKRVKASLLNTVLRSISLSDGRNCETQDRLSRNW